MYKVIVAMVTYNLDQYIEMALDSVLMQKTNFEYKIIVADDCSTDRTLEILRQYEKKYSEKIEILPSEKNLGALANSNRILDRIDCEYFTFLDGDDYWVGEERLQKQVDILDSHPEYQLCAGNTQYMRNGALADFVLKESELNTSYTFEDYLNEKMPYFHTSSILFRNTIFINGLPECYMNSVGTFEDCALRGDDFRRVLHLEVGPLYAMDELVSVYRIHSKGIWQGSTEIRRAIETAIGYNFYYKYFGTKYGDSFENVRKWSYRQLLNQLVIGGLLDDYSLTERDTFLLTGLFTDLASVGKNNGRRQYNKIELKVVRGMLKIIRKILA